MVKVITYGTFDMLHYGHLRLLERAKKLGDYLIVGITSDAYDKQRGKINVSQNLIKRIENVKATNLADEIIVEEYAGQKIDDIKKMGVDIFAIGSDWSGQFDYLNEYCKVVYLDRTIGVSSSELRSNANLSRLAIAINKGNIEEIYNQIHYVNGLELTSIYDDNFDNLNDDVKKLYLSSNLDDVLDHCDDIYIANDIEKRLPFCKEAVKKSKNVLCELPISNDYNDYVELKEQAKENNVNLIFSLAPTSSLAYSHYISLLKSRNVGDLQSMFVNSNIDDKVPLLDKVANSLIPVFDIFGTKYTSVNVYQNKENEYYRITLQYKDYLAVVQIGKCISDHDAIKVVGTKGVCKLHAPWETSGHISYSTIDNLNPIHFKYDGVGVKYALLDLIRHESSSISDENIKSLCDILKYFD